MQSVMCVVQHGTLDEDDLNLTTQLQPSWVGLACKETVFGCRRAACRANDRPQKVLCGRGLQELLAYTDTAMHEVVPH